MVESGIDRVFHALGSPVRRAMIDDLARSERTVGQLAEPHPISLAAASKHVQVLERAGLLTRTIDGRNHRCRLASDALQRAHDWLGRYQRFWTERLDALETELRRADAAPGEEHHHE